jgi:hypothetical protein
VVGDEVGRHAEGFTDLARGGVAQRQRVDDREPRRVAECRVRAGPRHQPIILTFIDSTIAE